MAKIFVLRKANRDLLNLIKGNAKVVLLQDGVYLLVGKGRETIAALSGEGVEFHVFEPDSVKRGISGKIPGYINRVNLHDLVQLIMDKGYKVINL